MSSFYNMYSTSATLPKTSMKQMEKNKRWTWRIHKAWIDYRILLTYSCIRIFDHSLIQIQIILKRQVQRP